MKIKIVFEKNCPDFKTLSKRETNPAKRVRLLALEQLKLGKTMCSVAQVFSIGRHAIGKWYRRYKKHGLDGLNSIIPSGRKSKIPQEREEEFRQRVIELQSERSGGRITAQDIAIIAQKEFDADYAKGSIYHVLHRLGFSWISARSKHPKADDKAQIAFKKTSNTTLPRISQKKYP